MSKWKLDHHGKPVSTRWPVRSDVGLLGNHLNNFDMHICISLMAGKS